MRSLHCFVSTLVRSLIALAVISSQVSSTPANEPQTETYSVRQTVTVGPFGPGARKLAYWISTPDDAPHRVVLDLAVRSAPGAWRVVHEPKRGSRFLYAEVDGQPIRLLPDGDLPAQISRKIRFEILEDGMPLVLPSTNP